MSQQVQEQFKKIQYFFRAKMGMPLEDEEHGILIQPNRTEERTRVKMIQVILHTQLRTLYEITGFNIYNFIVDEFDRYLISLEGAGRVEYITDRQPKVIQPLPPTATINMAQPQVQQEQKKEKK